MMFMQDFAVLHRYEMEPGSMFLCTALQNCIHNLWGDWLIKAIEEEDLMRGPSLLNSGADIHTLAGEVCHQKTHVHCPIQHPYNPHVSYRGQKIFATV